VATRKPHNDAGVTINRTRQHWARNDWLFLYIILYSSLQG